jgi:hypothetical protein
MDDKVVKEALSYSLGADLHKEWCEQELRLFFARAQQEYEKTNNFGEALRQACYKGETKRNEVELDTGWLMSHSSVSSQCLTDFETFKELFDRGIIEVKRFTKRELSQEEIEKAGNNYVDGKENILRDFSELSSASQKDNLEAARVVIELVYEKTMSDEPILPVELEQMGSTIHEEWLGRNSWVYDPSYGNPALAVPYEQLPKDEQDKDKAQIGPAQEKVRAYKNGLIKVEDLCKQYGIEEPGKRY